MSFSRNNSCHLLLLLIVVSTIIACGSGDLSSPSTTSTTGITGSLARFAIKDDKLFTLSGEKIKSYDITPNGQLTPSQNTFLNSAIETIFIKGNVLFVGTSSGMFIYELNSNNTLTYRSFYNHIYSCDPVVADDKYAYLTLNNSALIRCRRGVNVLEIIDIQNLSSPELVASYSMVSPRGLGIDSNLLFLCDDYIKVYDKSNIDSLKLIYTSNVKANDVIPYHNNLIATSNDGFYQYSYSNNSLTLLSSILIGQ